MREEQDLRLLDRTPDERVALALELGRRDVERFRLAQDPPMLALEARRRLERERQAGRVPSAAMDEIIG